MKKALFILLNLYAASSMATINYTLSFPDAALHVVNVKMEVTAASTQSPIRFKMPVWTPGSYKVREFSQHVDRFTGLQNGHSLKVERGDKNTWEVHPVQAGKFSVEYRVYAFDLGVRTSYVDLNKAFLHGVSVFMYPEGFEREDIELKFEILPNWKNVYVALPEIKSGKHQFSCRDYDLLADSPIAIGDFDVTSYECGGTPHRVVMIGKGNYDLNVIRDDFKKICDESLNIFGHKHPSPEYIHFIQNVDQGGGGLEHANCQTSQVNRWVYTDSKKYLSFLGLVAHEYFHLWNVKRIRPVELGPFNYNQETYTDMLWLVEGFTSYFDDLILLRCGFHTEESYFDVVAGAINRFENQPGKEVMTLAESSKLAWVKGYFPNENSDNVTVSYYNKGMLIAWLLDLKILESSEGHRSLDDVMKSLYDAYLANGEGLTNEALFSIINQVAGSDLTPFIQKYVYTLEPFPYQQMIEPLGLELNNLRDSLKPSLGLKCKSEGGKTIITYVHPKGSGAMAGLSVNDEVLALDGWRVKSDMSEEVARLKVGKEVELIYVRDGKVATARAIPQADQSFNYKLQIAASSSSAQTAARKRWMNF